MAEHPRFTLVCGPSRGGKSRWAEHLARTSDLQVHYLVTADDRPDDPSWQERIALHRRRRPQGWRVSHPGDDLVGCLASFEAGDLVLIDALGTWLARHLDRDACSWSSLADALLQALERTPATVVLVAEECGWGVVPPTAIGNLFRDRMGVLLERLHRRCDASWLVLHGRVIDLLALSQPLPEA